MNNTEPQVDRALEARINLYYDLRPGTLSPAPLLIALHGYGANKRYMMREAEMMAPAAVRDRVATGISPAHERAA